MLLSTVSAVQICGVRRLQISFVSATNTMLLCSVQIDGNLISQTRSHARPSCRSAAHSNLIRIIAWTNNLQYDLYHATLLHSMCVCVCHRAREYKKKNRQIKRPIKLQYHLYNDIETIETVDQWLLALAGRNMPQKYGASVQNITNNKIMHLWLSTFSISLVFFLLSSSTFVMMFRYIERNGIYIKKKICLKRWLTNERIYTANANA